MYGCYQRSASGRIVSVAVLDAAGHAVTDTPTLKLAGAWPYLAEVTSIGVLLRGLAVVALILALYFLYFRKQRPGARVDRHGRTHRAREALLGCVPILGWAGLMLIPGNSAQRRLRLAYEITIGWSLALLVVPLSRILRYPDPLGIAVTGFVGAAVMFGWIGGRMLVHPRLDQVQAVSAPPIPTSVGERSMSQHPPQFRVAHSGRGAMPTLQAALDAAPDGAEIWVAGGVFAESVVIRRPVLIRAENPSTPPTFHATQRNAFSIEGCNVTISNVAIQAESAEGVAVYVTRGRVELTGCDISRSSIGVNADVGAEVHIEDCYFHEGWGNALTFRQGARLTILRSRVESHALPQIYLDGSHAQIEDCSLLGGGSSGIEVHDGGSATVDRCEIAHHADSGVVTVGLRAAGIVRNSTIHSNQVGLGAMTMSALTVDHSSFDANVTSIGAVGAEILSEDCVFLSATTVHAMFKDRATAKLARGKFTGNTTSITLESQATLTLESCSFQGASCGVDATDARLTVRDCNISETNGGVVSTRSVVEVERTEFRHNQGVALGVADGSLTARSCVFSDNSQGCIASIRSTTTLQDCRTTANAGGIVAENGSVAMLQCAFDETGPAAILTALAASIDDSQLASSTWPALTVRGRSRVTARSCSLNAHSPPAVRAEDHAEVVLIDCQLEPPAPGGVFADPESRIVFDRAAVNPPESVAPSEMQPAPTVDAPPPELADVLDELDSMIGLDRVKREVRDLIGYLQVAERRRAAGMEGRAPRHNAIFLGPPGVGKTTVARLLAKIYAALGILERGQLVEVSRAELVGDHIGETAQKTTRVFESAIGGVLFIDEAYSLASGQRGGPDFGKEAVDTLVRLISDHQDEIVVIAAGYPEPTRRFLRSNDGLARRFRTTITFESYSNEELVEILSRFAQSSNYTLSSEALARAKEYFAALPRTTSFANAGAAEALLETMMESQARRLGPHIDDVGPVALRELVGEDVPEPGDEAASRSRVFDETSLEPLLAEFDTFVGLDAVKEKVNELVNLARISRLRRDKGLKAENPCRNLIFVGNPGTGKTTVARLLAQLYSTAGVLQQGHLVEVTREDLVAGFVGQTATQTSEAFMSALGGVLFIDEAYRLATGQDNDFGKEAVETLLTLMSGHEGKIVVIAAGYPGRMTQFLRINPGLARRFSATVTFRDLTPDECCQVFDHELATRDMAPISTEVRTSLRDLFAQAMRREDFGNAGFVQQVYRACSAAQAMRLRRVSVPGTDELTHFLLEDVPSLEAVLVTGDATQTPSNNPNGRDIQ